jgi:hypothetical protein
MKEASVDYVVFFPHSSVIQVTQVGTIQLCKSGRNMFEEVVVVVIYLTTLFSISDYIASISNQS